MADTEDTETLAEILADHSANYGHPYSGYARAVLTARLAARDERIRADEREKLAGEVARMPIHGFVDASCSCRQCNVRSRAAGVIRLAGEVEAR